MTSQPLRIAVLGTHSTGRTTLLKRTERELRGHGLTVARTGQLGKRAAAAGQPKMQHHTAQSTEWITAQGILDETNAVAQGAEAVLIDRAALDAIAYFEAVTAFRAEPPPQLERERLAARLHAAPQVRPAVRDRARRERTRRHQPRLRRPLPAPRQRPRARLLANDVIPHQRVTSDPDSQAHAVDVAVQHCPQEELVGSPRRPPAASPSPERPSPGSASAPCA
ncbi:AAA family ATPase [Streptomyces actuosus]|uniref:AAA family ATPase n=1 Tax=Streptomyces actuosus TaxID=1885 RepID=A0ABS2W034_STRAS|nr:AAA family ATPase [Streptomyces actuosus]MBN0048590.1 AAA family ATPase [Streptomyces actuosus]